MALCFDGIWSLLDSWRVGRRPKIEFGEHFNDEECRQQTLQREDERNERQQAEHNRKPAQPGDVQFVSGVVGESNESLLSTTTCSDEVGSMLNASTDLQYLMDESGLQQRTDTLGSTSGTGEDSDDKMKRWLERKQRRRQLQDERAKLGFRSSLDGLKFTSISSEGVVEQMLCSNGLPISLHGILGTGGFSRVYKATWTPEETADGIVVAVKILKVRQSRPMIQAGGSLSPPACLRREMELIDRVSDHPNLVRVLHASVSRLPYALVLDYCAGGNLHSYIHTDIGTSLKLLSWAQRQDVASDVAVGMAYLHSQNIVHRDLKSQNILLCQPVKTSADAVHVKVCDFGLAKVLDAQQSIERMTQEVGSWLFMAPEVFLDTDGDHPYTEKVDVYSFAMVIYTMLAGNYLEQHVDALRFVNFTSRGCYS